MTDGGRVEPWIERRKALIIGVGTYEDPALKDLYAPHADAARLAGVLTNPGRGRIAPADITRLNDPGLAELQAALGAFAAAVGPEELLLIYFSGHAIRDPSGEVFLACRDTVIGQPWTSALPGRVIRGLLENAPSRTQIVILDCCYAGGVCVAGDGDADAMAAALSGSAGARRVVLAASGTDQEAYERHRPPPVHDQSLFTDAIIGGLETGEADIDGDGMVSMTDLWTHVRRHLRHTTGDRQTPVLASSPSDAGVIPISRAPVPDRSAAHPDAGSPIPVLTPAPRDAQVRELDAPLQVLSAPIIRLQRALAETVPVDSERTADWLLDGVVAMLGADLAFICTGSGNTWKVLAHSHEPDTHLLDLRTGTAVARLSGAVDGGAGITAGWRATAADGVETIAVPLSPSDVARWLFVVGGEMPAELLIEPVATVCRAVCESHDGHTDANPLRAQAAAWDALRRRAGFVPREIYLARRRAFIDQLRGIEPHFQPVLYLHKQNPYIDGWEALARERGSAQNAAPAALFAAAELWGRDFMLLLDTHMLDASVRAFRDQTGGRAGTRRHPSLQGLTVNVYPDTLLSNEYFLRVKDLVEDPDGILGRELGLEISEKLPIPDPPPGVVWDATPLEVFKRRLREYTARLDVRLAIDDFGVGHGSLERLSGLNLTYVKLDQWFTEQRDDGLAMGFVKAAVEAKSIGGDKIVVEGFRDRWPFTLEDAFNLGVTYLQGAFVGLAEPELKRELETDTAARIRRAGSGVRLNLGGTRAHPATDEDGPPPVPGFGGTPGT